MCSSQRIQLIGGQQWMLHTTTSQPIYGQHFTFQPPRGHLEQIDDFHNRICDKVWYFYLQGILYSKNIFLPDSEGSIILCQIKPQGVLHEGYWVSTFEHIFHSFLQFLSEYPWTQILVSILYKWGIHSVQTLSCSLKKVPWRCWELKYFTNQGF